MPVKIYTMSDLHVDYSGNLQHLLNLNDPAYANASLIFAGDASDDIDKLSVLLQHFVKIFQHVFFVPGNHELWVRDARHSHSIEKFNAIINLCHTLGVHTHPVKLGIDDNSVWIVPLFSWYTKPEEGQDSLFIAKPGDDQTELIWSDNRFCDWQAIEGKCTPSEYFLALNEPRINRNYDAPIISFSHFLPLAEVAFPINFHALLPSDFVDPMPEFNFTRVAGTHKLAEQIKQLGSKIHVYGHQHRNRHREIDGVTYISHCLGYPRERQDKSWKGDTLPKLIWHNGPVDIDNPF